MVVAPIHYYDYHVCSSNNFAVPAYNTFSCMHACMNLQSATSLTTASPEEVLAVKIPVSDDCRFVNVRVDIVIPEALLVSPTIIPPPVVRALPSDPVQEIVAPDDETVVVRMY